MSVNPVGYNLSHGVNAKVYRQPPQVSFVPGLFLAGLSDTLINVMCYGKKTSVKQETIVSKTVKNRLRMILKNG